ncbi:DUF4238 domain-containing protein [Streptomyces caeruleatus]|uniref:DUF4238 domain-containing protein n=1 Tax=Streptomyces caeruleatus TaxID=661399 RepID=A0A101TDL7_9ACTN|nr:DUF4238 domain-containing protein [Streptomyces caeruleatus]KUN90422.1 hypothetical protein AQJ67_44085 [Streptomyces caeruleatus]
MKAAQISRQHLVSQVLLKQFTTAGQDGSGRQLRPVDVRNPERRNKLASTRTCGWADTFVAFDSASAENLWSSVERRAPAAFEAVHAGTPFADPLHVEALRDLVVLHYVRSHRYRSVYTNAFETVSVKLRGQLVEQYPEQLRREALRQTRLHLAGSGPLGAFAERLIEQSEVTQEFENGKLFRTSIEGMFNKVRAAAAKWSLEVLTPESGQFLVGDNPAVSVRTDVRPFSYNMAFGDAHSIVLPISPRHLLALGRVNLVGTIPRTTVNDLNTVQIRAADHYVYMHPRSTRLETFARDTARRWRANQAKR